MGHWEVLLNPWALIGGALAAIAYSALLIGLGERIAEGKQAKEKVKVVTQELVIERTLRINVPKIVTKTVTETVTVEKEVERVVEVIPRVISADCVLPPGYGELLVSAAQGNVRPPARIDEATGTYGCREVLTATLSDLKSGWVNSARLEGLQAFVALGVGAQTGQKQP